MASETTTIQNGILSGGWGNGAADYSRELAAINADLNTPGKVTNYQDRLNLQQYASTLVGQAQGAGLNINAANQPYSAPIPGAPDTGDATGGAGTNGAKNTDLMTDATKKWLDTGKTGGAIDSTNVASSGADWVKSKIGDIGLVIGGVVVVAVALIAATKSNQKMVIEAVKGAVT